MGYYLTEQATDTADEITPAGHSRLGAKNPLGAPFLHPILSTKYWDNETGDGYWGHRYYHPDMGRWLSRDPIGEASCGSLESLDTSLGLYAFVSNESVSSVDLLGLRTVISRNRYAEWWIATHPNRNKGTKGPKPGDYYDKDKKRSDTLNRGCVGITCINLGEPGMPDASNCYKTKKQAEARQAEMKKNCECKGKNSNNEPAQPSLYSTHLWNDKGVDPSKPDVSFDPNTGKADLSNWDYNGRPATPTWNANGSGGVNFDYGLVRDDGIIVHANHFHDPNGQYGPMDVYGSNFAEWQKSYSDFNTEVWCVACDNDKF